MRLPLFTVLSVALSFSVLGCGGGSNPDRQEATDQRIGTESIHVASGGSNLAFRPDGSVEGTGTVRTTSPFKEANGEAQFVIAMSLKPASKVTLVAFSDVQLTNGLEFEFSRASDTKTLTVTMKHGSKSVDVTSDFASVDASAPFTLAVDVHNSETPAHLIFWNDTNGVAGVEDFVLNTEDASEKSPGNGRGVYWGLRLENATVSTVKTAEPRHGEE